MKATKKYVAEFIGTFILVLMGCGTAMLVGCDAENGGGYILTAFAFGLAIVAMAYGVGNISGGHVNPAVSLGVFLSGKMSASDFCGYVIAQCLGALAGSGVLALIFNLGGVTDMTGGYGSPVCDEFFFDGEYVYCMLGWYGGPVNSLEDYMFIRCIPGKEDSVEELYHGYDPAVMPEKAQWSYEPAFEVTDGKVTFDNYHKDDVFLTNYNRTGTL
ncbi:MAG: aquaporin, partial [Lachnospiraceae bacterium]|nr:aquaporin [Lachnospiraceae bacterium]